MLVYSDFLTSWTTAFHYATFFALIYCLWKVLNFAILTPFLSPLRNLPGPPNSSYFYGNFSEIFNAEPGEIHSKWVERYGPTLAYNGPFGSKRLMTLDPKALSHVLHQSYIWEKPEGLRHLLSRFLGEGILFAEGDSHKRQRRIMNPSFSQSYIRELTVIFHEKSQQLRNILLEQVVANGGSYRANVFSWVSKATLDIIGLAGFDYEFNALNHDGAENELNNAFMTVTKQSQNFTLLNLLQSIIPIFRKIPTRQSRTFAAAVKVMSRIGRKLVSDKKEAILATTLAQGKDSSGNVHVEKSSVTTRDLLSRLMIANMAEDVAENQRLSDKDVLGQIPTFLVAGNETTATATTWCLYALSVDPKIQNKLRDELLSIGTDNPTMEELNSLPYLDHVIRETLRLHAPVTMTSRVATKDDVVPVGKPYKDRKGQLRHEICVRKGDMILIPIFPINTYKDIWGEDSLLFRPERWENVSDIPSDVPGVVNGLLTFLAGPRSCIGYRFALVEFKYLIFALVRTFNFELADPSLEIVKKANIVTRPFVKSELESGAQLPLKITPYRRT